jgi:tRNA nucleotidyltransferase (CCA-adding enzyme)
MIAALAFPERLDIPIEVVEIARTLDEAGYEAWCVGGAVRDALLGTPVSDFDLATSATPEQVQALFRRTVAVGVKYGTVGVLDRNRVLHEVTTFRRDVETDGRHAVVQYGASLEEDLARRDFTINALAFHPLRPEWRDPFGGAADLREGRVRAVGVPSERFREDFLRILRGIRFAARFDFRIDDDTWSAARAQSAGLAGLSAERVRDEWFKGLQTARDVARLVRLWHEVSAAALWLPGLAAAETVPAGASTLPRDPVLLTVLLTGDPVAVLRRLRASNAEIERAAAMRAVPEAPADMSPVAVRRWRSLAGTAADDLLALYRLRRGEAPPWEAAVQESRQRGEPVSRGELAVRGGDLQAIGVGAGPRMGRLLDELLERVLERPELNTREQLLALARTLA